VMNTASGISSTLPIFGGSGLVNLNALLSNPISALLKTVGGLLNSLLGPAWSSGNGSLEAARGSFHVSDGTSDLQGETDIYGNAWNPYAWTRQTSGSYVWNQGDWRGEQMAGTWWQSGAWPTAVWTGTDWSGASWTADPWTASTWHASTWHASTWHASTWHGVGWY
jgi:serine protease AprX